MTASERHREEAQLVIDHMGQYDGVFLKDAVAKALAAAELRGARAMQEAAEIAVRMPAGRSPSAIVVISDMVKRIRALSPEQVVGGKDGE